MIKAAIIGLTLLVNVVFPDSSNSQLNAKGAGRGDIIFKFDDFMPNGKKDSFDSNFQRIVKHASENKMHVSFGIQMNTLLEENRRFCDWVRSNAIENGGFIEFWFHGWDHKLNFMLDGEKKLAEFSGTSYEYQADHLHKGMQLFTERTGLTFHTFGAPGNGFDSSTRRLLDETPEIKVWLYGDSTATTKKLVLRRPINLEYVVGKVKVDEFLKAYSKLGEVRIVTLQGHPAMWNEESWNAYVDIVEILRKDKWQFITPAEFYHKHLIKLK